VEIVRTQTASELAVTVAWLHDVVEDTSVSLMDVYHLFGPRVATAVMLLTDPEGENRRARKAALHANLSMLEYPNGGPAERVALLVKAADRLANVRACVRSGDSRLQMYAKEHAAFREAAHRPGLAEDLWGELDTTLGWTP
jgi:(p)ppGpp synthase/HD superfamily hydrolase